MGKKRGIVSTDSYSGRLAVRLVQTREKAGYTVEEAVERVNKFGFDITNQAYRHWEANRRQVNWDALPVIAKALKVKPRDLVPVT